MDKLKVFFTFLLLSTITISGFGHPGKWTVQQRRGLLKTPVDMLVVGGTIVTMDKDRRLIESNSDQE